MAQYDVNLSAEDSSTGTELIGKHDDKFSLLESSITTGKIVAKQKYFFFVLQENSTIDLSFSLISFQIALVEKYMKTNRFELESQ